MELEEQLYLIAMRKLKETRDSKTKVEKPSLLLLAPNSIYNGERRSWRVGAVCNTVASVLSGSESHLPDQLVDVLLIIFFTD